MRQKTKNHQNQGPIEKKFDFFPQSLTHIPRWVHLVQKTRAKNSHAWAPLNTAVVARGRRGKDDRKQSTLTPLIGSLQSANLYGLVDTPTHAP